MSDGSGGGFNGGGNLEVERGKVVLQVCQGLYLREIRQAGEAAEDKEDVDEPDEICDGECDERLVVEKENAIKIVFAGLKTSKKSVCASGRVVPELCVGFGGLKAVVHGRGFGMESNFIEVDAERIE